MKNEEMLGDGPEIEDIGSNPSPGTSLGELIEARLSRRAALRGLVGAGAVAVLTDQLLASTGTAEARALSVPRQGGPSTLTFSELRQQLSQDQSVAEGYEVQMVIRWGYLLNPERGRTGPVGWRGWPDRRRCRAARRC